MTSPILPCKKTEKIMAAQGFLFLGGTLRTFFWGGTLRKVRVLFSKACLLYCFWVFFAPVGFENAGRSETFFLHVGMCVRLVHLTFVCAAAVWKLSCSNLSNHVSFLFGMAAAVAGAGGGAGGGDPPQYPSICLHLLVAMMTMRNRIPKRI